MSPTEAAAAASDASTPLLNAVQFIRTRRQQLGEHTDEELTWWIESYTAGTIPDYQMSAWLMAVCFNALSQRETATLTRCMTESGVRLNWNLMNAPSRRPPLVDKHSSGGVGDKVSIILSPLVATFGVAIPMMAGRGLGHTGGTIDKLESLPGFSTALTVEQFQHIVLGNHTATAVGCCITAAGPTLCPADQKMYALRDVTDTVSSLSLQTASIMCKKIAEHPDSLVLDVKYGVAAFQANVQQAALLATSMVATGEANGVNPTVAFLTRMDHPIGRAVGNWLEIKECIHIMKGHAAAAEPVSSSDPFRLSQDVITLVTYQAGQMLLQSGLFPNRSFHDLVRDARERLYSGAALSKFADMVTAQGGDARLVTHPELYPFEALRGEVLVGSSGTITDINALVVGQVSVQLGAGRQVVGERVDACAGIWFHVKVGHVVQQGELLAEVFTNRGPQVLQACIQRLQECIAYGSGDVLVPPIITHLITREGTEPIQLVVARG